MVAEYISISKLTHIIDQLLLTLSSFFWMQVSIVSRLKHENFVDMLGYCVEGNERLLAYEFATMGSLHDILHGIYLANTS